VRTPIFISFLVASAPSLAVAGTPWEIYLSAPSPTAAAAVKIATYSVPDEGNRRFEADLPVLENEVAAGDAEAAQLTVRLRSQFGAAAAILEYLDAILGRSIRSNPVAYLRAVTDGEGCPGAFPSGALFVDRLDARLVEARARANALRSVKIPALQKKRDECVAVLEQRRLAQPG
jgi:hypothetical protein